MVRPSRRRVLELGGLTAIAALSGCQTIAGSRIGSTPDENSVSLGLSISNSGDKCLTDAEAIHSGWVHTVAHGESYDLTFDVRVAHVRGEDVAVDLTDRMAGEYVLEFTTGGTTTGRKKRKSSSDSECVNGRRLKGGGRLPLDFETLRVTMNGREIQTLERVGTTATLRPLPDPIES